MGLGDIAKKIGSGMKKMGEGIKDRHKAEGAAEYREALKDVAENPLNSDDSSIEPVNYRIAPDLPNIDLGFYGHMNVSKTKKAFKSPTIMGGQNCKKGRKR